MFPITLQDKELDDEIITNKILGKSSIIGKKGKSLNRNAVQKQHLSFHRTPDGQLYVDKWGTMMTRSNCFRNFKNPSYLTRQVRAREKPNGVPQRPWVCDAVPAAGDGEHHL